ncbi:secretin N-terminal domain-containing protein [Enterococcus cecorum]|uniref:secretin N-terminal domain-containing protein n=1 Tax=Enterococcus cecorum TaxID=44008 RepID=UPI00148C044B|nr:secretin N-terminal domain-containing protein [Enterococcus cecorum]
MQEVRKIFEKGIDKYVLRVYNATSNEQRATSNEQRATSNEQRATSNEQRATSNEQRATSNDNITFVIELERTIRSVVYTGAICVATESVVA